MAWLLAALPLPAGVLVAQVAGAPIAASTDPTGGWLTALSGLGVAGILCAYLAFDNSRLRKEVKECTDAGGKKDEAHAKLLVDMLARYERLLPIETESQRIHTESIKVLERSITMMHQLAGRPSLDQSILSKLDPATIRKLIGGEQ